MFQREKTESVLVARDELALAALDVCNRSEAVVFEFEKVVVVIEGAVDLAKAHRLDSR